MLKQLLLEQMSVTLFNLFLIMSNYKFINVP